jgi:hypothetical protein
MMSNFFMRRCGENKRGGRVIGLAATHSFTQIALPSSASGRGPKIVPLVFLAVLISLGNLLPGIAIGASLSHEEATRIGRQVWQNECAGTLAGLTSWNAGEDFASLGIGHFIWYPAGRRGPFEESFPKLLDYLQSRGTKLPAWLRATNDAACPWNSRTEFLAAQSSPRMIGLHKFLAATIDLQADFLVHRLHDSLPKILAAAPASERAALARQFDRVGRSAQGSYALVDYVNFKGEGTLATERYRGRGWGLLQVLEQMSANPQNDSAARDFARAAAAVLRERVANAPPQRHEERWLRGWLARVATYARA